MAVRNFTNLSQFPKFLHKLSLCHKPLGYCDLGFPKRNHRGSCLREIPSSASNFIKFRLESLYCTSSSITTNINANYPLPERRLVLVSSYLASVDDRIWSGSKGVKSHSPFLIAAYDSWTNYFCLLSEIIQSQEHGERIKWFKACTPV